MVKKLAEVLQKETSALDERALYLRENQQYPSVSQQVAAAVSSTENRTF